MSKLKVSFALDGSTNIFHSSAFVSDGWAPKWNIIQNTDANYIRVKFITKSSRSKTFRNSELNNLLSMARESSSPVILKALDSKLRTLWREKPGYDDV